MIWKENKRTMGHIHFVERVWHYAAINFIKTIPPRGQTPSQREQKLPGTIIVYKNPPPGQNMEFKGPTPGRVR